MSKSLTTLGKICLGGPYTTNVNLAEDCANDAGEVSFPDDFFIQSASTGVTIDVSITNPNTEVDSIITIGFNSPENGQFADNIFHYYDNFYFDHDGENLSIEESTYSAETIVWRISSSANQSVAFTFKSNADFDEFVGWDVQDAIGEDASFNITWGTPL